MIRAALVVLSLTIASAANASEWRDRAAQTLFDFEQAIKDEKVIDFVAPLEHPEMVAVSAAYLGLSIKEYLARVKTGYAYSTQQSDMISFRWASDTVYGASPAGDWAITSYQTTIALLGQTTPVVSCARVVIFGDASKTYVSAIASDLSQQLFVKAVPDMARALRDNPAQC